MNKKPTARHGKPFIYLAAATVYAVMSGQVQAGREVAVKIPVDITGLDLNQPAGARILYGRLRAAARYVCGSSLRVGLETPDDFQACYQKALSDAVRSVNQPQLTQVYLAALTPQPAAARDIDVFQEQAANGP